MKKLTIDKVVIELTRRCNMTPVCGHCFRGDPQNITLDNNSIDNFLQQIEIVGGMLFTGGEPTLAIDKMRYILSQLHNYRIPLFDFEIVSNGLIYNDEIVQTIKDYSDFIRLCFKYVNPNENITEHMIFGISIDKFHNHNDIVKENLKRYKEALKGYAQVVRTARGNITRNEGKATQLNYGMVNYKYRYEEAILRRIEILDKDHIPLCPHFKSYRLIKPEQIKICCDLYLSANGNLLTAEMGEHAYNIIDFDKFVICNVNDSNIYEAILQYNIGRVDCLTLINRLAKDFKSNPLKNIYDGIFLLAHGHEDNSEPVEKQPSNGYMSINSLLFQTALNDSIIPNIKQAALTHNYKNY